MSKAFTTGEVANYCDVNFRTVIRWIEKGLLNAYRLPGTRGDHRITLDALIDFMKARQMPIPEELQSYASSAILVIEDEQNVANAIRRVLTPLGVDLHFAQEGFEAGVKLSQHRPKVVTLDMQMPGVHGLVVLNLIKQDFPGTKVVVVSAAEDSVLAKALAMGADAVIAKPFDNTELRETVAGLIGSGA